MIGSLIISSLNFIFSSLGLSLETEPIPSVERNSPSSTSEYLRKKKKKKQALYTILEEDEGEEEVRDSGYQNIIFCRDSNKSEKSECFFNHQAKASKIAQITRETLNQESTMQESDFPSLLTSSEKCTPFQDIPQGTAKAATQDSSLPWPLVEVVVKPSRNLAVHSQSDDSEFPIILYDEIKKVSDAEIERYQSIRRRADKKVISLGEYSFFRRLAGARLLEQEQALKSLMPIVRSKLPPSTLSRKYAREHLKRKVPRYCSLSSSVIVAAAAESYQAGKDIPNPQYNIPQVISTTFCEQAASNSVPASSTNEPTSSTFAPPSSSDGPTSSTHVLASTSSVTISSTYIPSSHSYQCSNRSSYSGRNRAIQNPTAHPLHPALSPRDLGVGSENYSRRMSSSTEERSSTQVQINLGYVPHTLQRPSFGDGLEYFVDITAGWLH